MVSLCDSSSAVASRNIGRFNALIHRPIEYPLSIKHASTGELACCRSNRVFRAGKNTALQCGFPNSPTIGMTATRPQMRITGMIFSDCFAGLDRKAATQATGCSGSHVAISTAEAEYQSSTRNAVKALLGSFPFHSRLPATASPAVGAR